MRAAMAGMRQAEEEPLRKPAAPPRPADPPPADPPPGEARFSRPRPGSRSLPAPPRPIAAQVDPLTTGVVPGASGALRDGEDGPGPYTTELMMDGLDEKSRAFLKARQQPAQYSPGQRPPTFEPAPVQAPNPTSQRLPEIEMPPADSGRARPLTAKPRASAWRPPPAPKPERPSGAPEPGDELTYAKPPAKAGARSLDELLTLADEPPEREDTVSSSTIDLGVGDPVGEEPAPAEPPAEPAKPPRYTPASRAPAAQAPAPSPPSLAPMGRPPPEPEASTLTGSLELLDEEAPADPVVMPRDAMQSPPLARVEPRPASRPAAQSPSAQSPSAQSPSAQSPSAQSPSAEDPLATRPIPKLPDPELTVANPVAAPAAKAEEKPRSLDSNQLRRETYKPKEPGEKPADKPKKAEKSDKEDKPRKPVDREYREPILAWLASIVGLILIGGGVVIAFAIIFMIMAR